MGTTPDSLGSDYSKKPPPRKNQKGGSCAAVIFFSSSRILAFGFNPKPKRLEDLLLSKRYAGAGMAPPHGGREGVSVLHYYLLQLRWIRWLVGDLMPDSGLGFQVKVLASRRPWLPPASRR